MQNHFFPHGSAELVGEIVHFVHDDEAQVLEQVARRVQHVPKNLRRHDDDSRGRIDARVAGQKPDFTLTVDFLEVLKLLVGQRFHGRRVKRLVRHGLLGQIHGIVGDYCFSGSGRRRDEHATTLVERFARRDLKRIERERL